MSRRGLDSLEARDGDNRKEWNLVDQLTGTDFPKYEIGLEVLLAGLDLNETGLRELLKETAEDWPRSSTR